MTRSAAGRLAMEAIVLPSALLPSRGAKWTPDDDGRATFRITVGEETVWTTVEVDADGRPVRACARRWSGSDGRGYDVFVVELGGELRSGGYTIRPGSRPAGASGGEDECFFRAPPDRAEFR